MDVGFHGWDGLKSQFISKWHPENPQGWAWLSEHPTSKPGLIDIYLPWPIEEEREAIRALVADFTRDWLDTQTGRAPKTSAAVARL